ncbi:aminotransferase-like domain-containing protein [Amphritea pacifica]|uniref:PLP-dependent aminotransferase family protein n=1 Tax=Amphritea pacifica TaxID=2811233 RepID=A0ABS2W7V0_9GAMM|nr:PLP-dependent aminotransferase family protein [Amphritea pacifica]MBN0987658.1 PLP-dependent aminotransferase family protein [Amphritea pacifica]
MRYKQIAHQYITDIQQGRLKPGQRLPSLRRLAQQHDVSMTTALNGYHLLEELGWAIARPQAGYFVATPLSEQHTPSFPTFKSEATTPCQPTAAEASASRLTSTATGPLGVSLLAPELLPTEAMLRTLRRACQRQGAQVHAYPDPQGDLRLRSALASHFSGYGFNFSAPDLVVTNGCLDAVRVALEVTSQPGDVIAINSPCFNGLLELLAQMGRRVLEIPSTSEGIDLRQLDEHMAAQSISAALFSTTHMNPQGITLSVTQKQQLAEMAARYQIPVIEDDVYLELGHGQITPLPVKHWDKAGYLLWCGSISKTLAAGYRLGWCLPGRYLDRYLQRRTTQSFGASSPIQLALAEFINSGQYRTHLRKVRLALARQISIYAGIIKRHLPDSASISSPTGGTVLWVQLPGLDTDLLYQQALQQEIDLRVGALFSTRELYADCFRINTGWPIEPEHPENCLAGRQLLALLKLIRQQLGME